MPESIQDQLRRRGLAQHPRAFEEEKAKYHDFRLEAELLAVIQLAMGTY